MPKEHRPYRNLIHLNGNLLCAIDVETTGLNPFYHDLCQICVVPLDSEMNPIRSILPFDCMIKPRHMERVDPDAMSINKDNMLKIMQYGIDSFKACDLFEEWFQKLGLGIRKKISPLGQNWRFDWTFIANWLGPEHMDYFFDGRYRDTMTTALFLNDYADAHIETVPFPKVNLQYLSSCLKVQRERPHEALSDCLTTAEIYKRMLRDAILHLPLTDRRSPDFEDEGMLSHDA